MQKRFLFTCLPGYGHFHPLVPLARGLAARGHEVAFAAREFGRERVEKAGFRFFPIGSNRDEDAEYAAWAPERELLTPGLESERVVYTKLFVGITPRLYMPTLVEVAKEWKPDVFVREAGEYAAVMAAEVLGVPHATVAYTSALQGMAVMEAGAAARLDPIRAAWGLQSDPELKALYRYLYLAFAPPSFATHEVGVDGVAGELPTTTRFIRPAVFDRSGDETLPAWMDELPKQPTVYCTLGTEVNMLPEFYPWVMKTLIEGLRDLPVNLIVTLGRERDPADFGAQPPNVHIERYIPQSLVLSRCDLMVMHGGSNSILAALDAGLPVVITPLIADQFFNANVSESMGLGTVVRMEDLKSENVRAAAQEVLSNPSYRATAQRLKQEMDALPGVERALEMLEEIGD